MATQSADREESIKMKMPLSEIIDRYTITLLKSERTDEDVSEELTAYKKEIPDGDSVNTFIDRMYEILSLIHI